MNTRLRLSVVIIIQNGAELLPDCLSSVSWADEIIVLDSGSSDDSIQIATQYGAKVFQHTDWQGYGKQRQLAQSYASSEMILMIDVDERVTPELRLSIEKILAQPIAENNVYSINRRNLFLGRFMRHSGWAPDYVTRLYPRHFSYNDNLVHESLNCTKAQQIKLPGELLHLTCRDLATFQRKQLAYAEAWAIQSHQRHKSCSCFSIFGHTLATFLRGILLRAGFLDGKQGWLLAVVNAQYTFNKYTMLWALNRTNPEEKS